MKDQIVSKPVMFTKTGKPIKHSSYLDLYKDEIAQAFRYLVEIIRTRLRRMGIKMDNHGRTITA